MCGKPLATAVGKRCVRLVGPHDKLCAICDISRCKNCVELARFNRKPPCSHVCDACFHGDGALSDCGACGRVPNGFCEACMRECIACEAAFCPGCCFAGGALLKCDGPGCDAVFCEPCGLDQGSMLECSNLVCPNRYCEGCAYDGEMMQHCEGCDEQFCFDCAESFMNEDSGELLCPDCLGGSDDSNEYW
jgi:hypothetical protein